MTPCLKTDIDPEDLRLYHLAKNNRWPRRELYHHIAPSPPFFVHDSLMLPWVLATALGLGRSSKGVEETAAYMTHALLQDHVRLTIVADQSPTIVKTAAKGKSVDGMLVAGLRLEAARRLEEYIGPRQHRKELEEVEVVTEEGERVVVCACVFVWDADNKLLEPKAWSPTEYMKSRGANSGRVI